MITVRLTPRADRDALDGLATLSDGREVLKVRVRAVPEDGAANRALVETIAKRLKVPKSAVELVSGQTQRLKQVRITGAVEDLARRIGTLAEGGKSRV